jgi:glycosyltransferase involved in cell wall biosynthesis
MRVLMVIAQYPPLVGGAEIQAQRLATSLVSTGVQVRVITGWVRGTAFDEQLNGVVVERLLSPGLGNDTLKTLALTARMFQTIVGHYNRFDVLHVHIGSSLAYAGVLAARRLRKPSIVKIANSSPRFDLDGLAQRFSFGIGKRMARYVADHATRFVAMNPQIVADLSQWGVPEERIARIPNGVPLYIPCNPTERTACRQRLGLPATRPILVCVASLHPKKNHTVLLQAFKQLAECGCGACLVLLGDGPQRATLEHQARADRLQDQIMFAGRVTNVLDYLYAADVFVLPSVAEGLSNALLEAMSVGLPCVVSDIAGNRALVADGITGRVCAPHDAAAFAQALATILKDRGLATRLGLNARQTINDQYSIHSVAQRYHNLYQLLVNG